MELFASVLLAVQVLASLSIIVLVLLQQGKGADMGAAFGGGSAGSLFGAAGAANFLSRMTKWAAIVFFACTIGLAWVAHHPTGSPLDGGVMQGFETPEVPAVPGASEVPGSAEVPGAAVPGSAVPGAGEASDAAVPGAVPSASGDASADVPSSVPQAVPSAGATSGSAD